MPLARLRSRSAAGNVGLHQTLVSLAQEVTRRGLAHLCPRSGNHQDAIRRIRGCRREGAGVVPQTSRVAMTATQPHLTFDTRAEQIRRAFEAFHTANPHVWKLFEQFALETIFAG